MPVCRAAEEERMKSQGHTLSYKLIKALISPHPPTHQQQPRSQCPCVIVFQFSLNISTIKPNVAFRMGKNDNHLM